jgi:hypothetical protein
VQAVVETADQAQPVSAAHAACVLRDAQGVTVPSQYAATLVAQAHPDWPSQLALLEEWVLHAYTVPEQAPPGFQVHPGCVAQVVVAVL